MPTLDANDSSSALRVGVFDSGVGGLSVLRSLRALLPAAELTYVADSGNAPYGERDDAFVAMRSERIATWLLENARSQLLVVACNTATAAAVHRLRELWPLLPIVGVEPGLKPAVAASKKKSVCILATPSTLRSGKFQRLLEQHGVAARVHLQPCPGLAAEIEKGEPDSAALIAMIEDVCKPLKQADVDVVVLGCTHYAFAQHHIARAMGDGVAIIDTADAVARHAVALARGLATSVALARGLATSVSKKLVTEPASNQPDSPSPDPLRLLTTGRVDHLADVAKKWLAFECSVETLTC